MALLIMAICRVLFEKLYTILRRQKEPRRQEIANFSFKMFKIMTILRSSKYSKTTAELTFTTQKANTCSRPWTNCFVFDWKYPFWENFSLSWNLVLGLIQICRTPWWCSLFLYSTDNTFLGKFGWKNQNCQFMLKFST